MQENWVALADYIRGIVLHVEGPDKRSWYFRWDKDNAETLVAASLLFDHAPYVADVAPFAAPAYQIPEKARMDIMQEAVNQSVQNVIAQGPLNAAPMALIDEEEKDIEYIPNIDENKPADLDVNDIGNFNVHG